MNLFNLLKLSKRFPLLTRFILLVLLVLSGGYYVCTRLLGSTLPPERMQLFPDGALSPVFMARDVNGVPHIRARTDEDAFFAIGYAHAQDRLWQLELQRRTVHGELSELFGRETLKQDIWYRSLNLHAAAQSAWPALSDQARRSLQKYVDGVNAGMAAQSELPVEFRQAGIAPQRWTVYDSLARLKLFALNLSGSFQLDLTREAARQTLTTAQLRTLFPGDALEGTPAVRMDQARENAGAAALLPLREAGLVPPPWGAPTAAGGNAWAVAGRHGEAGAALLANDLQLELQIPSPWYAVHAKGERLAVSGMSLVGVPLVIFGRNDRISWGGASLRADSQDVYFENTDPDDASRYQAQGQWLPFVTRKETIQVRAESGSALVGAQQRTVSVVLRATKNGPLISDQFAGFDRPVSLRWVGFDSGDTSYEAWYRLQFAADWQDFRAALSVHATPALKMVYADIDGNIGAIAAGKVPVRKQGGGALPAPGWDQRFAWAGYVPVARLPAVYNPATGFVVAANQQEAGASNSDFIGRDWASPARAERIAQLLQERLQAGKRLGPADMKRIQGDDVDLDAAALAAELVTMRPDGAAQAKALGLLRGWNGTMAADSQPAAIFNVWTRHLRKRLLGDKLQQYWNRPEQGGYLRSLDQQMGTRALRQALAECRTVWRPATAAGCDGLLQPALQAALDEIGKITGSRSMADWRWGALQRGVYAHPSQDTWRPFNGLFERGTAQGGSPNTVNAADSIFIDRQGFEQRTGGSFRQVFSLGEGGIVHEFMNSTGQSGNVASRHYADMVEPFSRLEYTRLAPDETAGRARSLAAAGAVSHQGSSR
ncbi:penicillin acylase family protein [Janthinobacterium sp. SUN120]|uniref:penicillin acylase family protein n=1 Tax=Janthinobacterium sp. SUN120 TaxID=3004099 RepID=UPI0025B1BABD|nr:penicillin acylase family protein [Janthinobacterium sp. SUN120]MDN2715181.1 penicillin acylase family protein [Janthinobacterium sp. SUN120]